MSKKGQQSKKVSKMTPVEEMITMTESINKEIAAERIGDEFSINHPQVLSLYTEKPNNNPILIMQYKERGVRLKGTDPDAEDDQAVLREPLPKEVLDRLALVGMVPRQKYRFPQTASQEVGWLNELKEGPSRFNHKRSCCKETLYANNFFTMKKLSPFSNKIK